MGGGAREDCEGGKGRGEVNVGRAAGIGCRFWLQAQRRNLLVGMSPRFGATCRFDICKSSVSSYFNFTAIPLVTFFARFWPAHIQCLFSFLQMSAQMD